MKAKQILWASFFANAASFLFTVRPRYAITLISIFVITGVFGNYLLLNVFFSQPVEFCLVIAFVFLPVVMNAVFLSVHEANLRHKKSTEIENLKDLIMNIGDLLSNLGR